MVEVLGFLRAVCIHQHQGHCKVGEGCPTLRAVSAAKHLLLNRRPFGYAQGDKAGLTWQWPCTRIFSIALRRGKCYNNGTEVSLGGGLVPTFLIVMSVGLIILQIDVCNLQLVDAWKYVRLIFDTKLFASRTPELAGDRAAVSFENFRPYQTGDRTQSRL